VNFAWCNGIFRRLSVVGGLKHPLQAAEELFRTMRVSLLSPPIWIHSKDSLIMLRVLLVLMCCTGWAVPSSLADVTGRWRVTISSGDNALVGVASLDQSGEKVTGWMGPNDTDTTPVSGTLKGDRLTLKTHPKPGFAVPFDTCELTINADRLTGSIQTRDSGKSTIEFVRTRQEK
jgi:hypothetical protein